MIHGVEKIHQCVVDFSDFIPNMIKGLQPFLSQCLYFWENHIFIFLRNQLNENGNFCKWSFLCTFYVIFISKVQGSNGKHRLVMYTGTVPNFKTSFKLGGFFIRLNHPLHDIYMDCYLNVYFPTLQTVVCELLISCRCNESYTNWLQYCCLP